jgi:hypothetical protein
MLGTYGALRTFLVPDDDPREGPPRVPAGCTYAAATLERDDKWRCPGWSELEIVSCGVTTRLAMLRARLGTHVDWQMA